MKAFLIAIAGFLVAGSANANSLVSIFFPTTASPSGQQTGTTLLNSLSAIDPNSAFSAQDPNSAQISTDDASGGVFSVTTDDNGADILVEFTMPVASITVYYPGLISTSCSGTIVNCYAGQITGYSNAATSLTPAQVQALPAGDQLYQSALVNEPTSITIGSGTQNDIYALQIESSSTNPVGSTLTQIDEIQYLTVNSSGAPEPGTLILLGAGLAGLGLLRRRRC